MLELLQEPNKKIVELCMGEYHLTQNKAGQYARGVRGFFLVTLKRGCSVKDYKG